MGAWGEVLLSLVQLPGRSCRHGALQEKQEPGGAEPRVRYSEPRGYRVLPGDVPPAGARVRGIGRVEGAGGCRAEQHLVLLWGSRGFPLWSLPSTSLPFVSALLPGSSAPAPPAPCGVVSLFLLCPEAELRDALPGRPVSVSRLWFRARQVSLLCLAPAHVVPSATSTELLLSLCNRLSYLLLSGCDSPLFSSSFPSSLHVSFPATSRKLPFPQFQSLELQSS